ncbi:MAG: hypothetical protein IT443_11115 [Phycisphaeraceae bacterium]|nr:hypothetical protein [Phycisphaeraceae bacterium]
MAFTLNYSPLRRAVLLLVLLLLPSCTANKLFVEDVSPGRFLRLYDQERYALYHLDYRESDGPYVYLDVYDVGEQSLARKRGSYRTLRSDLPRDFPSHPQLPIQKQPSELQFPPFEPTPTSFDLLNPLPTPIDAQKNAVTPDQ